MYTVMVRDWFESFEVLAISYEDACNIADGYRSEGSSATIERLF